MQLEAVLCSKPEPTLRQSCGQMECSAWRYGSTHCHACVTCMPFFIHVRLFAYDCCGVLTAKDGFEPPLRISESVMFERCLSCVQHMRVAGSGCTSPRDIDDSWIEIQAAALRSLVLSDNARPDGRGFADSRQSSCQVTPLSSSCLSYAMDATFRWGEGLTFGFY